MKFVWLGNDLHCPMGHRINCSSAFDVIMKKAYRSYGMSYNSFVPHFRIVISVQPVSGPMLEEVASGESSPDSLSDTCPMFKQEPSPFSSKPVMYDKEEVTVFKLL